MSDRHRAGDPNAEYEVRVAARRSRLDGLNATDRRYGSLRLAVFGAGVLVLVLAWQGVASAWLLAVPVALFGFLVQRHERIIRARDATAGAVDFYERGLARIQDRWQGSGEGGDRFREDRHPYAIDLDLFGQGSLFQLLSVARTRAGEAVLADWLAAPAAPQEITARQQAVQELADALDLRESLAVVGNDTRSGVHRDELLAWAEAPPQLTPTWVRWLSLAMTLGVVAAAIAWLLGGPEIYLLVLLGLQAGFAWPRMRRIEQVLHGAAGVASDLAVLGELLRRLEPERFNAERLAELRRRLDTGGTPATSATRNLGRLVEMHDWQHNLLFLMLSLPFMWGTHVAWAIEAWRRRHGRSVRQWLDAVAEFEALASLAAYRFEHPDDPFPEIVSAAETAQPVFDGVDLGHPLLPAGRCVRNSVRLDPACRLLVVSGSNMSGKSTLLRTVGINAVLGLAGAPVRAASLRLSPVALGATLRIQDSLQEGRSRFYAEITRLRELFDIARQQPLLFLLDELFHGTNSHDRLVGASAILKSLVAQGAIGLVSTHDLALTAIVQALEGHARNVHFEDRFEAGEIRFDYRMRPGPVTHSNALALMRAVGLEVPGE